MIFLLVAAALVVGAPLAAAILVSFASRREDAEHTLTGRAPGPVTAMARRLLCSPTATSGRTATRGRVASSARPADSGRAGNGGRGGGNGRVPAGRPLTSMKHPADGRGSRPSGTGPELPQPRAAADAEAGSWHSGSARTGTLTLPRT